MPDSDDPGKNGDVSQPPILSYQRNAFSPLVTVRTFYNALDAQMLANELDAAGIRCTLTNQNTNTLGPYSAFSQVELQVRQDDAGEARQILARYDTSSTEVEPEEDLGASVPVPDPSGRGTLVTAGAFDTASAMFDAAAALGAAHVECFLPVLVPRGDRPRGHGKRFIVRVREDDVERARHILERPADDSDEDPGEPRCPECGSWRTRCRLRRRAFWGSCSAANRGHRVNSNASAATTAGGPLNRTGNADSDGRSGRANGNARLPVGVLQL
jgi:putative signal transducing protein